MKHSIQSLIRTCAVIALAVGVSGCGKSGGTGAMPIKTPSAEKTSFAEVTSRLDAGGSFYVYLSTDQLVANLSGKVAQWQKLFASIPDVKPEDRENIDKVFGIVTSLIRDSGIEEVTGFGASSISTEPGIYHSKGFLHHYPGKGEGFLWRLMGEKAHDLTSLNFLPANTALAMFSDANVPLVWSVIKDKVAKSGFPQAQTVLNKLPEEFEFKTGLNWEKVLASLGGEFGVVLTLDDARMTALPGGLQIPEPGLAIVAKINDDTIFNRIDQMLSSQTGPDVIRVDKSDLKMRTVPLPLPFVPFRLRPTMASSGGYLFIASTDNVVQDMLGAKDGGLKSTEEFKRLSKNIPLNGNQFTFVSERFGRTIMQIQQQALAMASQGEPAKTEWLQSLVNSGGPAYSFSVSGITGEGLLSAGNGNQHPGRVLAAVAAIPAVMAAVAVPNFVKARETAQRNACISNLRLLQGAKQQWALEQNKAETAVPSESDLRASLQRQWPVCPKGGQYTLGSVKEDPRCSVPGHSLPAH